MMRAPGRTRRDSNRCIQHPPRGIQAAGVSFDEERLSNVCLAPASGHAAAALPARDAIPKLRPAGLSFAPFAGHKVERDIPRERDGKLPLERTMLRGADRRTPEMLRTVFVDSSPTR
jgi:hypothetical protein